MKAKKLIGILLAVTVLFTLLSALTVSVWADELTQLEEEPVEFPQLEEPLPEEPQLEEPQLEEPLPEAEPAPIEEEVSEPDEEELKEPQPEDAEEPEILLGSPKDKSEDKPEEEHDLPEDHGETVYDAPADSTLSIGDLRIVIALAVLAVGAAVVLIVSKKKKTN